MIHRFKAYDCPDANGRVPNFNEHKWTISIPLENGDDYLEIEIGEKGRCALLTMLEKEKQDDNRS